MFTTNLDKRKEERSHTNIWVKVRTFDELSDYQIDALIVEVSGSGATLLPNLPLPAGTRVSIELPGLTFIIAEVVDWQWDYHLDKVRLGVKFTSAPPHFFEVKKMVL